MLSFGNRIHYRERCFALTWKKTTFNDFVKGETGDNQQGVVKVPCQFKVGDKVRVDLEPEILKAMQDGHGGWNPRMAEVGSESFRKYLVADKTGRIT